MRKICLLLVAIVSFQFGMAQPSHTKHFEIAKNMDIFNSIIKELQLYYVDSIPMEDVIVEGIDAMLKKLDPYTNYIPESDKQDFVQMTTGEYGGIGSIISQRDNKTHIIELYKNAPAYKNGLQVGDKIIEVDGKSTHGLSVSDVSALLKGTPSTEVQVKVERNGTKKLITFKILREKIYVNPVTYYGLYNGNVGYIRLNSFTENCAEEVKNALQELHSKGAESLIFDLRSNGGGLINDAIAISGLFVPKGTEIVSTKGRSPESERSYKTSFEPLYPTIPLIVMVNENSASAAEIVAGAMQDLDRAVVIGRETYGKGMIQSLYALPYNTNIKITIAKYYTPSGRCVQSNKHIARMANDSLTNTFTTKNGRIVKDGHGILPDVISAESKLQVITYHLLSKSYFYEFANHYTQKLTNIAPIEEFAVSESLLAEFKQFILSKDFTYDLQSEKSLLKLIEIAKAEGYYEQNKTHFDNLTDGLTHDIAKDFDVAKDEITELLAAEIVKRYYFQAGELQQILKNDPELKEALEIIGNKTKYSQLLQP
ncbi:MAG: S41 family peptidase [Paludibacteraceae bacterium]|nr:S41 family peptidase [Paludibacteraceae bacterium]MBP6284646.1 S41 family peptidase [Paludibacteraceae bacterium]